jgi:hypothetical protein
MISYLNIVCRGIMNCDDGGCIVDFEIGRNAMEFYAHPHAFENYR